VGSGPPAPFDTATGNQIRSFEEFPRGTGVRFSPDGKMRLIHGVWGELWLVDLAGKRQLPKLEQTERMRELAFSPDFTLRKQRRR
jgi:hypothetical protein